MTADPTVVIGPHGLERLATERTAWLTSVNHAGQPESAPIWFLWTDAELIIYSDHRARRNANVVANPKVVFHLDTDEGADDVMVIEGEARIDPAYPSIPENPAYLAKYGASIEANLGGPETMAETYSLPIRIRATRTIGLGS